MNLEVLAKSTSAPEPIVPASGIPGAIRLWQAVASAHAALTLELEADGGACPVLASDAFAVLLALAGEPGHRLRMRELAGRSHLTPSGLTRRVDRLESDGLVDRVGCPGDRRGAFAQLTERGLGELQRALPHHAEVLARYTEPRLDEAEAERLIALLGDLAGGARPSLDRGRIDPSRADAADPGR